MTAVQKEKLTEVLSHAIEMVAENTLQVDEAVDFLIEQGIDIEAENDISNFYCIVKKDICDDSDSDECYCCIDRGTLANSRCIHHKVEISIEELSDGEINEAEIGKTVFTSIDKAKKKVRDMLKRSKRSFIRENLDKNECVESI